MPPSIKEYGCFDPSVNDLGQDIGITRKQLDDSCLPLNEMSDDAFRTLAQNLNLKQKDFFYHVYHWLMTETDPLFIFLSASFVSGFTLIFQSSPRRKP